jgi:hypothetical protein
MPGYSGTPLARKLSLKDGQRVWWENVPDSVRREIEAEGLVLELLDTPEFPIEAGHVFISQRTELEETIQRLLPRLDRAGFLWISWPKKASGEATDVTEDVIRDVALPLGLVDVKVCAVDLTWSGLKLMIRRELR